MKLPRVVGHGCTKKKGGEEDETKDKLNRKINNK